MVQRLEGCIERAEGIIGAAQTQFGQLTIAGSEAAEGILVEPRPDMQAVFFDPAAEVRVPTACAFAAKPPASLADGDVEAVPPPGQQGQGIDRTDRAYTSTDRKDACLGHLDI